MNTAELLKIVHTRLNELKRQRMVSAKRDRLDRKRQATQWEIFLDDCKFHGYDWNNEDHRSIIVHAWLVKNNEPVDLDLDDDDGASDAFTRGEF